ncbi:protein EFFECTOR OF TRANSCRIPTION 2 [Brachypodium distachyon]|uniref:GIY-YIG domain-containing protein n=1 Tax=Brachypodium distachyon TaxID=15368 RepID=I1GSW2_BRADI|nr:protein EFFECTOR OF TRANSCRIPTION 2 [Brachypodium distachyon]KQK15475.1 hypothetical protein BRADI_1g23090v3 [Brachypodium distachyon]|eukprot:XP_003562794.1 protein EFFECTOR OF TRANSCRIPTION 2 [Brachypodium distachyon]
MPAAPAPAARLKREDCPRTKHDSLFSPWKVLVGPSDWEDHAAGKEGVQRYHTLNLPDNFPGLYELGVARPSSEGVRARRNLLGGVVVMYLGQADNVRARLQQYGRTGSHLDTGNPSVSVCKAEMNMLEAGPGLFREVFSRGYSVVFRCALMGNKKEAEKTEGQLLRVFDYAWNKLQNGACRREEILLKLEVGSHRASLLCRVRQLKQKMFGEKAGIKISSSASVDMSSDTMKHMLPRICTFVGFRPRIVNSGDDSGNMIAIHPKRTSESNTTGNKQAHRRSEGYKVKKINVIKRRTAPVQESNSVCGVVLEDGSSCLENPVEGRKRCELHKGRRVTVIGSPKAESSSSYRCQVGIPTVESVPRLSENRSKSGQAWHTSVDKSKNMFLNAKESSRRMDISEAKEVKTGEALVEDVTSGTSDPESQFKEDQPSGRMWFELLKAQKLASRSRGQGSRARVADDMAAECGIVTDNGCCRLVPVAGSNRCKEHEGIQATGAPSVPSPGSSGWPSICGARASDGSPCKNQPSAGRKRCALHKGQRAASTPLIG